MIVFESGDASPNTAEDFYKLSGKVASFEGMDVLVETILLLKLFCGQSKTSLFR